MNSSGAVLPKDDAAYAGLMNYIDNDDYLKNNKGKMSERNAARSPWSHQIDLRINQEIPTFSGHKLELTFDILNLTNLINNDWGWVKLASDTRLLTFHSVQPTGVDAGKPRYRWVPFSDPAVPSNLSSRWQAQLGIRYTF